MCRNFTYLLLYICLSFSSAQALDYLQSKQADSLIQASIVKVYDNPSESIELGLKIFEDANNSVKTRTKALMLVSLAYTSKRDYQKALEYTVKAEEFSKELDDKVLQIEILFKTGILYQQLKIFDKSIEFLEKTEQMALIYPDRELVGKYLANSYTVKGFIYKDNLNCDIALEFFDKGIKEYKKLKNVAVNTNLSIAYYNRGNCYTLLADYDMAIDSFNKSITYANMEEANSLIAFAQKGLAEVYTDQGRYEDSIVLLNEALEKSQNVGDIILNSSIYNGLFENYLAINNWEKYEEYYNLYSKTQLDIKSSERKSVDDSISKIEDVQSEELTHIKSKFKNQLTWLGAIFLVIIFFSFFIIKNSKSDIITLKKEIKKLQEQE